MFNVRCEDTISIFYRYVIETRVNTIPHSNRDTNVAAFIWITKTCEDDYDE